MLSLLLGASPKPSADVRDQYYDGVAFGPLILVSDLPASLVVRRKSGEPVLCRAPFSASRQIRCPHPDLRLRLRRRRRPAEGVPGGMRADPLDHRRAALAIQEAFPAIKDPPAWALRRVKGWGQSAKWPGLPSLPSTPAPGGPRPTWVAFARCSLSFGKAVDIVTLILDLRVMPGIA